MFKEQPNFNKPIYGNVSADLTTTIATYNSEPRRNLFSFLILLHMRRSLAWLNVISLRFLSFRGVCECVCVCLATNEIIYYSNHMSFLIWTPIAQPESCLFLPKCVSSSYQQNINKPRQRERPKKKRVEQWHSTLSIHKMKLIKFLIIYSERKKIG